MKNATSRATSKRCERCRETYALEAFAVDASTPTGRQSWCRRCKTEWERGPHGAWCRFAAWLEANEPHVLAQWNEHLYTERWKVVGGCCEECGASLTEWQFSGHRLDRIDNKRPHVPGNCRFLCWPCNRHKSNRSSLAARKEIQMWVAEYGRGKVPWRELTGAEPHDELPDISRWLRPAVQLDLPLRAVK